MLINCGNYYNDEAFKNVCRELESHNTVEVYIDCIGHTRNNNEQEAYKKQLIEKYGDSLIIECRKGNCSYSYSYKLNER